MNYLELYQQIDTQLDYENWRDDVYENESLTNNNKFLFFGHTRLSIFDTSPLAHQPLIIEDNNKVPNINKLSSSNISITVEGNTNENSILSSNLELVKLEESEIDYEITFPKSIKKNIVNIFSEGDVIELLPSDNKDTSQLKIKDDKDNENSNNKFLINKIDKLNYKFKLNNSENIKTTDSGGNTINILEEKEYLIKKVNLKNTIKNYYEDKKDFYKEHLLIKNKAKNLGIIIDRIKESMGHI